MADPIIATEQVSNQITDPAIVAAQVRQLLGEGQLQTARGLIAEALENHPIHAELLSLQHVIMLGRVEHKPDRYPNRQTELDWIDLNRNRYQGKWVALVGKQVVAIEDDAKVLLNKLKQRFLGGSWQMSQP